MKVNGDLGCRGQNELLSTALCDEQTAMNLALKANCGHIYFSIGLHISGRRFEIIKICFVFEKPLIVTQFGLCSLLSMLSWLFI